MSEEERARAFDRFWQSSGARRDGRPSGHFGLGLAIVRELVTGDGGSIALDPARHGRPPGDRAACAARPPRPEPATPPTCAELRAVRDVGVTDLGPVDELREREALEDLARLLGHAHPHLLEHAVALAVVVLVHQGDERAVDRGEDVGERDLLRRARQHVATAHAALRAHQPRALHRQQDLLEVRLREPRALRDLLHRRRAVRSVQRERQEGRAGVVAPRRHLHPGLAAARRAHAHAPWSRRRPAWARLVPDGPSRHGRRPSAVGVDASRPKPDYGRRASACVVAGAARPPAADGSRRRSRGRGPRAARARRPGVGARCEADPGQPRPSHEDGRPSPPWCRRPRRRAHVDHHGPRAAATASSGSGCASTTPCSTSSAGSGPRAAAARPVDVQRHRRSSAGRSRS